MNTSISETPSLALVQPDVLRKWDAAFAEGSDKSYPSLDLVRLEHWFFGGRPGRLLEYAFGSGVNLIHLLKRGYRVDAIDISGEAKKLVERKLAAEPEIGSNVRLLLLDPEATRLPFEDEGFDYVVCMNVLSLLSSRQRVEALLGELVRVMKPNAKVILDINAPTADFARGMKSLGDDVYQFGDGEDSVPTYCPPEETFHRLVGEFLKIDDTGFTAFKYMHSAITEFIVCAHKE